METHPIMAYVEPIYRFCCARLQNRCDAEDLSSEIICHVLQGMNKYQIKSLDAWVWRIAHNRYARFIDVRRRRRELLAGEEKLLDLAAPDDCRVDEDAAQRQYEDVFRFLHTLSAQYRNIFVDHYVGALSVRDLAQKYALPETTIKWRLNVGRQRIRERIGGANMERVYQHINWCIACNGNMAPGKYLSSQLHRAMCLAAYEKPLTVEEMSLATGIPALYIEDELPLLEYGEAIVRMGAKYATGFIIFRKKDQERLESVSVQLVQKIADGLTHLFQSRAGDVADLTFYGHDFGMERLGHFIVPYLLRKKILFLQKEHLHLEPGPFPPRQDGGYGWFLVSEQGMEETTLLRATGCNGACGRNAAGESTHFIYYYWLAPYQSNADLYHHFGTRYLCEKGLVGKNPKGAVPQNALSREDAAQLLQNHLLIRDGADYRFNFACFTQAQFAHLTALLNFDDAEINKMICDYITAVRTAFADFVPARLHDQINQWVLYHVSQLTGCVMEELMARGVLKKPRENEPLTDGIFCVEGEYIHP